MVLMCWSIFLSATCTPIPFDRSTIGVILTTVMSGVQFVWPSMFFAQGAVFITKAHLFRLFGDVGVDRLHLALSFSPFGLDCMGRHSLYLCIILDLLKN